MKLGSDRLINVMNNTPSNFISCDNRLCEQTVKGWDNEQTVKQLYPSTDDYVYNNENTQRLHILLMLMVRFIYTLRQIYWVSACPWPPVVHYCHVNKLVKPEIGL